MSPWEEAWLFTLDQSEWAESIRSLLLTGSESRSLIVSHLLAGPDLPTLWQQLVNSQTDWQSWSQQCQKLLTPEHQFHKAWQQRHASAGPVLIPLIRIDEHLWRGPQPDLEALASLKEQGLSTIFNLRNECRQSEKLAEDLGLSCVTIPVQDMSVPGIDQVLQFLDHVASKSRPGSALVHCFAGQGRTGLFVAGYRIWKGMAVHQAIELTDRETRRRGMREPQRAWLIRHSATIQEHHARI